MNEFIINMAHMLVVGAFYLGVVYVAIRVVCEIYDIIDELKHTDVQNEGKE